MPKVSVLMPVYRTDEKYLREAIESILNQTFTDFEFLILDDCPDDDREKIVKSYKDKRIKYSKNDQNLGITPTRNKLIDMASGEYLAVFDHDDISLPERLEKQVAYLDEHQDVGVVSCWYKKMPKNDIVKNPISNYEIEIYLMDDNYITHSACMLRKSVLSDNNIKYNSEYSPAEDYALCVSLIGKTKFHNIPEVLFLYRLHETNTSKKLKNIMTKKRSAIQKIAREQHPDLYQKISFMPYIVRMKLFGIIPLGKFIQIGKKKNILLKCLPFISCKFKREITTLLDLKKLSVIITVYNEKPEYIERAITSLNNQNFQNLEIIVVDDGSKNEDTLKFLDSLKQDNLKIIHKKNGGLGSARNLGLQHTSGDAVGFLDADDWVEKDFYSKLMNDLTSKKTDIACGVLMCNNKSYDKFPRYIASTVQEKLKYINNGSVCSKIFKKELFNDIKFPEAKIYYEDNPVLLKLLLQADKVSFNPKAEYIYFTNDTSITRNKDESKEQKRIDDSVLILEQIKKWADSYDKKTSDLIMLTVGQILFRAWQYTKNEDYRKKIDKIFTKEQMAILIKPQLTFAQKILSLKKAKDKSYKIITIFGIQIKIKR